MSLPLVGLPNCPRPLWAFPEADVTQAGRDGGLARQPLRLPRISALVFRGGRERATHRFWRKFALKRWFKHPLTGSLALPCRHRHRRHPLRPTLDVHEHVITAAVSPSSAAPGGSCRNQSRRDSFHQLSSDRRAQVPARLDVGLGRLPHHHNGVGGPHPTQTGRDGADCSLSSLGALVTVEVQSERPAPRRIEAWVVTNIERMLACAGDVRGGSSAQRGA